MATEKKIQEIKLNLEKKKKQKQIKRYVSDGTRHVAEGLVSPFPFSVCYTPVKGYASRQATLDLHFALKRPRIDFKTRMESIAPWNNGARNE